MTEFVSSDGARVWPVVAVAQTPGVRTERKSRAIHTLLLPKTGTAVLRLACLGVTKVFFVCGDPHRQFVVHRTPEAIARVVIGRRSGSVGRMHDDVTAAYTLTVDFHLGVYRSQCVSDYKQATNGIFFQSCKKFGAAFVHTHANVRTFRSECPSPPSHWLMTVIFVIEPGTSPPHTTLAPTAAATHKLFIFILVARRAASSYQVLQLISDFPTKKQDTSIDWNERVLESTSDRAEGPL